MSKLSFRARALDASKPMPIYLAEELPDLPDYSAINRAVPQMPSGMEKEEESEHHLQRAISGTGLIIPTPEVCQVSDLEFYERCYPPDYKIPKQHIHMQPLWEEQEAPEYDIDTEDERWLKQQRHPELTELKFEQMMDKLEKSSGQTVVTLNEAKLLLERQDDLVIAVYDYWLNKRLNTQHALVLSVKTENRPGQSSNNPYLAFRRRTEKMQTRKNRKNDESSYEKMLKLRRDLARALCLLEMVAKRERAKRDLVRLTALIAEKKYATGDFAHHPTPEPTPRPTYTPLTVSTSNFRREQYPLQHYPPRPPPTPIDQPRQREKRQYKRRKHRHPAVGTVQGMRDSGVYTSSEEESTCRVEGTSPSDDGPFAFRRKPGCYYEMPTSTLCGDPIEPTSPSREGLFEHELDERNRFTLTSVNQPYPRCVGFARRRVGRGGRVLLDRVATPLDDLWPRLPFHHPNSHEYRRQRDEEVELETKAHRTPKEMSRDYHTSGKYPWRHAFRQHLSRNPELWTCPLKTNLDDLQPSDDLRPSIGYMSMMDDLRPTLEGFKPSLEDLKPTLEGFKPSLEDLKPTLEGFRPAVDDLKPLEVYKSTVDDIKVEPMDLSDIVYEDNVKSDISVINRTIDSCVKENLNRVLRKRAYSACSDSSYDSDESLHPVEREFEKFINEVNKKWLHFRPKTPPHSPPPSAEPQDDQCPIAYDTPLSVELRSSRGDPFVSAEFTLGDLCAEASVGNDSGQTNMDISGDDLLAENFTGLTEDQVESILSETDLKAFAEEHYIKFVCICPRKIDFILYRKLYHTRLYTDTFGSTVVSVAAADEEPIYVEVLKAEPPPPAARQAPTRERGEPKATHAGPARGPPAGQPAGSAATPVPTAKIIVEEVNEVPIKIEKKKKEDTLEEVQLPHGVQLKTVQTKHSPLKKHIITSSLGRRASEGRSEQVQQQVPQQHVSQQHVTQQHVPQQHVVQQHVTQQQQQQPQIVTVAVSDSLKVRLQNHLLSSQAGVLVQNGPFPPVAVAVPVQPARDAGVATVAGVSVAGTSSSPRRVSAPLVHLAPAALAHKQVVQQSGQGLVVAPSLHHVNPNKLKVLHAHSLTHTQRTQLLTHNRTIGQLPTVVSLATLADGKTTNAALLKAAPGSVAQLFEIKSGQLGKGPHLVNVVRQPQPGKTTVARLDLNDKKRQVVATFDGTLKGNIAAATRPHRVSLSLDGRQIVRTAVPSVRAPHLRNQIQLKNRTFQVAPQIARASTEPSTSITISAPTKSASLPGSVVASLAPTKSASLPSSVVANLLHKNVSLPKSGQKIAISGPGGQPLSANVQAIAFTAAQLKARQARLIAQPRAAPVAEIVEASTAPVATSSTAGNSMSSEGPIDGVAVAVGADGDEAATNGAVRRQADTLPMEVT
ncbi:hypothetical protein K1T71_014122 [Dendrolimus kikuchii]|uniref:Uncharacterized protein n=1 Tax=Dendrolimus kikuchii TaxID=765133 RepID=A0ACC1CF65_9NEOP|nr:hypothetical protein K1T71_014122 [Dendrolimus kikuchii]